MSDPGVTRSSRRPIVDRLVFFLLAGVIGALVGIATLLLIEFIRLVQWIGYGSGAEHGFAAAVEALPAWRVVLVPTVGGLLVGVLLRVVPGRRYHGIADVMEACAMNSARMEVRSGLGAALASGISLGVGAPLGREGPAVHIGASLSAWVAERLGLDHKRSLALLGCGAAAAVAVSFNTPIAAVIFALEVVVGYYTLRVFAPIVIAVMFAMVVRQLTFDSAPLFYIAPHDVDIVRELPLFALLGLCGALVGRVLIGGIESVESLWRVVRLPRWLQPAMAGLAIGVAATQLPLVLGFGLEGTALALGGSLAFVAVATLLLVKLALVVLALGSGFAGGVFGPAIFIGAMLGGTLWQMLELIGLPSVSGPGTFAAIGMAATASALLGAPISTVLIVFELTRDYGITLGVMTAAAVASTAMQFGPHASFFRWQLARRGVNISAGRDISLLVGQRCESLVCAQYVSVPDTITAGELESRMGTERQRLAMFIDAEGVFRGSVSLTGLISHAIEHGLDAPAVEAAHDAAFSINTSTNIVSALQVMAERQLEYVPVVERLPPPAFTAARLGVGRRAVEETGGADETDETSGTGETDGANETGETSRSGADTSEGDGEDEAPGHGGAISGDGREVPDAPITEPTRGGAGNASPDARARKRWRLLGVVLKSDLLAEHYDVVKRAREEEFGVT